MQEGYAALDCGKMRNARQIHNFLYGVGSQKSEARLTACHNVGMVAEDGQCLCSQRTRRYMEYAGKQFAGNFIHIGNHQQKTLRCCICCCQRTSSQGTMYCTGRTCFGLHFYNFYSLSEKVLFAIRCPIVCFLSHWGRRCDGENASYFSKRIGSVCSSLITVHRFHYFRHSSSSLKKIKVDVLLKGISLEPPNGSHERRAPAPALPEKPSTLAGIRLKKATLKKSLYFKPSHLCGCFPLFMQYG